MATRERLPSDRQERELIALYAAAAQRLEGLIAEALASGKLGTLTYRRARLRAVRKVLSELVETTDEIVPEIVSVAYEDGVGMVDELVGEKSFGGGVHTDAMQVLADNLAGELGTARETVGRRAEDVLRREGIRQAALSLAEGSTRREASAELVATLQRQGRTGFVDRSGRQWALETYAQMAIRTTTREAVSTGTRNRMLEQGLDVARISSHHGSCPICRPYDGKTFSLTGNSSHYPHLDRLPPFHPNCRHVLTPAEAGLADLEAELGLQAQEKSIGDAMAGPATGSAGEALAIATGAIDQMHGVPDDAPRIPAIVDDSLNAFGQFATVGDEPHEIRLLTRGRETHSIAYTAIHEIGHYIDFIAGPGEQFRSETDIPEMQALKRAWQDSDAVRLLRAQSQSNLLPTQVQGFLEYLLRPEELWARSYQQWIMTRTENPDLARAHAEASGSELAIRRFWSDDDFQPIAEALDELLGGGVP